MENEASVSLLDITAVLVRRRRMIATAAVGAFVVSAIVSLILPRWYESTALILPPDTSVSQLDISGILQSVGFVQPAQLPTLATPSDLYKAILESHTVRCAVVDSFDLVSVYKRKSRQRAVEALKKHSDVGVTDEGLIRVAVEDRSPERAADMVNAYVFALDRFNKESSSGRARRTREFIERRLAETEVLLQRAEEALKGFQQSTGVIALPEQAAVSIETAAEIWRSITALEVAIAATGEFESEQTPNVVRLRAQIKELKNRLNRLDRGKPDSSFSAPGDTIEHAPFLLGLRDAPDLALRYGRLFRDVEIQRTVHAFLTRQLEEAKIQEARDTPTIQVLDAGIPADIAARPKKKVVVAAVTGLALLLAVVWCFVLERLEGIRSDPETSERWKRISGPLRGDLSRLRKPGRPPEGRG
ncbi:MAG: Wzz/FepE/Etk N-terminal domain-containing protein [Candidatus Eisenbacteria bacterium]